MMNGLRVTHPERLPEVIFLNEPAMRSVTFSHNNDFEPIRGAKGDNTYPSIKILRYVGPAMVEVSCVANRSPYSTHLHGLISRDGSCQDGVFLKFVQNTEMILELKDIGIQYFKRKDFDHTIFDDGLMQKRFANQDMSSVRLRVVVYIKYPQVADKFKTELLNPIVSDIIVDKAFVNDESIYSISRNLTLPSLKRVKYLLGTYPEVFLFPKYWKFNKIEDLITPLPQFPVYNPLDCEAYSGIELFKLQDFIEKVFTPFVHGWQALRDDYFNLMRRTQPIKWTIPIYYNIRNEPLPTYAIIRDFLFRESLLLHSKHIKCVPYYRQPEYFAKLRMGTLDEFDH